MIFNIVIARVRGIAFVVRKCNTFCPLCGRLTRRNSATPFPPLGGAINRRPAKQATKHTFAHRAKKTCNFFEIPENTQYY